MREKLRKRPVPKRFRVPPDYKNLLVQALDSVGERPETNAEKVAKIKESNLPLAQALERILKGEKRKGRKPENPQASFDFDSPSEPES